MRLCEPVAALERIEAALEHADELTTVLLAIGWASHVQPYGAQADGARARGRGRFGPRYERCSIGVAYCRRPTLEAQGLGSRGGAHREREIDRSGASGVTDGPEPRSTENVRELTPGRVLAARFAIDGDACKKSTSSRSKHGGLQLRHRGEADAVGGPGTVTPQLDRQMTRQRELFGRALGSLRRPRGDSHRGWRWRGSGRLQGTGKSRAAEDGRAEQDPPRPR